mgnify:CR=1 FL=1
MATSVMQVRVDDDLRAKAAAVYEELGIDLPTAIRMFLKRSVVVNGVPFSMTLPKQEYRAERAIRAMHSRTARPICRWMRSMLKLQRPGLTGRQKMLETERNHEILCCT